MNNIWGSPRKFWANTRVIGAHTGSPLREHIKHNHCTGTPKCVQKKRENIKHKRNRVYSQTHNLYIQKKQRRLAGAAANYLKAIELFNNYLLSLSYTVAVNDSNNVDTLNRSSALGTTCCVVLNAYYLATLCNDAVNRSRIYVNAYQTPT